MTSAKLQDRDCEPYSAGQVSLDASTASGLLAQIDEGWASDESVKSIARCFTFGNYYETLAFVNAVAWIAHQQDHHPDLLVRYRTCEVVYSTHSVGGLSINDFICAAKIDALIPSR
ncbi:MAG: 4a-hydroxytetrahydrobiopterin dehydratase [Pseudomonadota bacterium]